MNKIQLFRLLRKNAKLSEKRHPMFEANQYGKLFGYLVAGILAIEFIALGTFMGWIGAKDDAAELIFFIMPIPPYVPLPSSFLPSTSSFFFPLPIRSDSRTAHMWNWFSGMPSESISSRTARVSGAPGATAERRR